MSRNEPVSRTRCRSLRLEAASAESILWRELRNRRAAEIKFRRQHPIGPYVVDFACLASGVVVELDGDSHTGREVADRERQDWLESRGWIVLRFYNTDVWENLEAVLERIVTICREIRTPRPNGPIAGF